MALDIGSEFARYRIERELGKGGMGRVYLARRADLPRDIALKVLLAEVAEDAERFRLEARTTAQLRHPHIVTLFDFGIDQGQPWMALDFIDGGDLATRLQARPLAYAEGFNILRGVAEALDYAHSKGVIHRDLKPQNILLSDAGHAYLADFGIAKLQQTHSLQVKTATGSVVGTPSYMSPEQASGQTLTPASDQYALAVICFEWLTGSKPFTGDQLTIMYQHLHHAPPEALLQLLQPATAEVLRRGLAKVPGNRFASARALIAALEASLQVAVKATPAVATPVVPLAVPAAQLATAPQAQTAPASSKSSGLLWSGIAVATALALGLNWPRPEPKPEPKPFTAAQEAQPVLPEIKPPAVKAPDATAPGTIFSDKLVDGSPGPEMVWLPAGSFLMGSPEGEADGVSNERLQHGVNISAFAMGRTEVTVGQFAKYADAMEFQANKDCDWSAPPFADKSFKQSENHPVVCVSWDDAQAYVAWLSKQTKKDYGLPSEAQQEYAIRAIRDSSNLDERPAQTIYPWGNDVREACTYANVYDQTAAAMLKYSWDAVPCTDPFVFTSPVATFKPNAFGLYDTIGNVLEWGADGSRPYPLSPQAEILRNPVGPTESGEKALRALRGGSWFDDARHVRAAHRLHDERDDCDDFVGFRLFLRS
jgi:serine/threonine protein kinase